MKNQGPNISVDLVLATTRHLDLLGYFYKTKALWYKSVLDKAVKRYTEFWLPLYKTHGSGVLHISPPLDVYFVWYLHMLAARSYHLDCLAKFGRVFYHEFDIPLEQYFQAVKQTRGIWEEEFPSVPFEPDFDVVSDDDISCSNDSGTDSITADDTNISLPQFCKRAKEELMFYYDVSLPHYKDQTFLLNAVERYLKFLVTLKHNPVNSQQTPQEDIPVDVILIWKTHKLYPISYTKDINPFFSKTAKSGIEPTENGITGNARTRLFDLVPGTLTRERQALEKANVTGTLIFPKGLTDDGTCQVTIDDIRVTDLWSSVSQMVIECRHLEDAVSIYSKLFEITSSPDKIISSANGAGLATVRFNHNYHRGFEFHIFGKSTYSLCFKSEHHIGTVAFNPRMLFPDGKIESIRTRMEIPRISCADPKVTLNIDIHVPKPKPLVIRLEVFPFSQKEYLSQLGSSDAFRQSIASLPSVLDSESSFNLDESIHVDEVISVANHRLIDSSGAIDLRCRISHCHQDGLVATDTRIPAVLLIDKSGKALAGARFLKAVELPRYHQVSAGFPAQLHPDTGEKAMVIFNKFTEWGICIGKWCQIDDTRGYLEGTFCDTNGRVMNINPGKSEEYSFEMGDLEVDLQTGKLAVQVDSTSPAEYITLAFVVSMLYVVCRSNYTIGKANSMKRRSLHRSNSISSLYQKLRSTGITLNRSLCPDYFPFLVASGIQLSPKFYKRQITRDNSFKIFVDQMRGGTSSKHQSQNTTPSMNRSIYIIPNEETPSSIRSRSYTPTALDETMTGSYKQQTTSYLQGRNSIKVPRTAQKMSEPIEMSMQRGYPDDYNSNSIDRYTDDIHKRNTDNSKLLDDTIVYL